MARKTTRKTVVAFDPGVKNLAVWKGYADLPDGESSATDEAVHTLVWRKIDITAYGSKRQILRTDEYSVSTLDPPETLPRMAPRDLPDVDQKRKGIYALVVNALACNVWIWEGVDVAVIETQDPTNTPARVVACTIYGFLRAKFCGTPSVVCFSGSASKAVVKKRMAEALCVQYDYGDCVGTATSHKAYANTKHTSYAICRAWMLAHGGDRDVAVVQRYHTRSGPLKGDDVAEAFLLGAAELTNKHGYQRRKRVARPDGRLAVGDTKARTRKRKATGDTRVIIVDSDTVSDTDSDTDTTTDSSETESDEGQGEKPGSGGSVAAAAAAAEPPKKKTKKAVAKKKSHMVLRPRKNGRRKSASGEPGGEDVTDAALDAFFASNNAP